MKREDQFILLYKEQWHALENYIDRIAKTGYGRLSNDELKEYLSLTKRVSHHLALAKSNYRDSDLVNYLNDLVVRANNNLYIVKGSSSKKIINYILTGFPSYVNKYKGMMLLSALIFMVSMIMGYILVLVDAGYAVFFLPEAFLQARDWSMEESAWQEHQFVYLSSLVMVNNIGVGIKVFAFGIVGGVITAYILFVNGAMLGALTSLVYVNQGNMINYLALILPHGIIEITAIIISGGAGLMIGKSLLIPSEYKRKDALIKASKEAAMLIPGIVIMLILAGLIEGFITPFRIDELFKLGFSAITLLLVVLYFRDKKRS